MKAKISVVGIGPGGLDDMTSKGREVISNSKIIIGYKYYIPFIESLIADGTEIV
ncbi:MAG: precorrin-3B C(17)-methyltransferase, partial [Muribaculaceae bacterium]|nr:precorrin-3B C(17)-methyltransferase [Muribaculaceae bacterium]